MSQWKKNHSILPWFFSKRRTLIFFNRTTPKTEANQALCFKQVWIFSQKHLLYVFPDFWRQKRFFFSRNTSKSALANSNFETESVSREKNKSWDPERKPPANWEPRRVRKRGFSASAVVLRVWCMCELRSMVYLLTQ